VVDCDGVQCQTRVVRAAELQLLSGDGSDGAASAGGERVVVDRYSREFFSRARWVEFLGSWGRMLCLPSSPSACSLQWRSAQCGVCGTAQFAVAVHS
jgi:hypothetical protein